MNGKRRLLLIAPSNPDLPAIPAEVMGFVNARSDRSVLDVFLLQGTVTEETISSAVASYGQIDIWWFASHGDANGIFLSGSQISVDSLIPLIKTSGANLVVLNSCFSIDVATRIVDECKTDVVATITSQFKDTIAYRTSLMFANNLVRGLSYQAAYEASKPGGNRSYVYLRRYQGGDVQQVQQQQWNTEQGIVRSGGDRLFTMVDKIQETNSALLVKVAVIENRLSVVENDIKEIKESVRPGELSSLNWKILMGGVIILFIASIILFVIGRP
jgi:hypothetical protein